MKDERMAKIEKELHEKLICTFGYFEVEEEILMRCMEAISTKTMDPLKKDLEVFCPGTDSVFKMSGAKVALRLHRYGIWQYVEEKIKV